MRAEMAEAEAVFRKSLLQEVAPLPRPKAIYTIARGSSDAAANILSYEFMRELGLPMTSLPPSVFSVGAGVELEGALALVVSQSGASEDLVRSAEGARARGARVVGLINAPDAPVAAHAERVLPIGAGPELAVPATKSVVGAIAAGMALLGGLAPAYRDRLERLDFRAAPLPDHRALVSALLRARHVYVIGRDTGLGAAQEFALKLKETCAIHAEAHSSSEVLHGPLQLATNPLLLVILDTEAPEIQASLDQAEARFRATGASVMRLRASSGGGRGLTPAAAAAALLCQTYPVVLDVALALGHDPDRPETLAKVTQTL
jgi:glucosamine--fructose-6-phosphate aminotransferase (isomerizing)